MPDDKDVERSESGAPIYRHQPRNRAYEAAAGDPRAIELIEQHLQTHIGPSGGVFHEIVSDLVHLDIHFISPTPARNYHTLVTSGMSDRPMSPPPGAEHLKYAELMICLPPTWPLTQKDFEDEKNYWPLRWLKMLARLPHEHKTWLWASHTVPNGDPPRPFAANTELCCALLAIPSTLFSDEFIGLKVDDSKTIYFLSILPIYREEMDFKLKHGVDPLLERLEQQGVNEVLNVNRKNACG